METVGLAGGVPFAQARLFGVLGCEVRSGIEVQPHHRRGGETVTARALHYLDERQVLPREVEQATALQLHSHARIVDYQLAMTPAAQQPIPAEEEGCDPEECGYHPPPPRLVRGRSREKEHRPDHEECDGSEGDAQPQRFGQATLADSAACASLDAVAALPDPSARRAVRVPTE